MAFGHFVWRIFPQIVSAYDLIQGIIYHLFYKLFKLDLNIKTPLKIVTMMSHERHGVKPPRIRPFIEQFVQGNNKENTKCHHYWSSFLCSLHAGICETSYGINHVESVSMPWRHYGNKTSLGKTYTSEELIFRDPGSLRALTLRPSQ